MHSFQNLLTVLPPTTLYKVETRKKILDTRDQHCLWGEGRGWTCVNWKTPQKRKRVPRLLSMIVVPVPVYTPLTKLFKLSTQLWSAASLNLYSMPQPRLEKAVQTTRLKGHSFLCRQLSFLGKLS